MAIIYLYAKWLHILSFMALPCFTRFSTKQADVSGQNSPPLWVDFPTIGGNTFYLVDPILTFEITGTFYLNYISLRLNT